MLEIDRFSQTDKGPGPHYDFEIGSLLVSNGNFQKSLPHLKKSLDLFLKAKDFSSYSFCCALMIQALNELGKIQEAKELYNEMEKVCLNNKLSQTAHFLACSAYYNIYIEGRYEEAKQKLNSGLTIAFDSYDQHSKTRDQLKQNESRFDIIKCLYVYSIYYFKVKDYENCVRELKSLKILLKDYLKLKEEVELNHSQTDNVQKLQFYDQILKDLKKNFQLIQKMRLGLKFMEALVELGHIKNYSQAEKLLWELYEEANKTNSYFFVPYVLCALSWCHIKLKNKKQAQMFFNLAKKNTSPGRKPLISYMEKLEQSELISLTEKTEIYDLVFDIKEQAILEKRRGYIDLKNQFVLMDLLKLFLLNPGVSFSKEKIIQTIWKQDYYPEKDDNKIYVTIKRLREMIESAPGKPYYICRNSAGYYFSEKAKVLVKQ